MLYFKVHCHHFFSARMHRHEKHHWLLDCVNFHASADLIDRVLWISSTLEQAHACAQEPNVTEDQANNNRNIDPS